MQASKFVTPCWQSLGIFYNIIMDKLSLNIQ